MTLRNLQIFATVAECCNMTKAAEKLYISQPSVSMAISDIEREYDRITSYNVCYTKLLRDEVVDVQAQVGIASPVARLRPVLTVKS